MTLKERIDDFKRRCLKVQTGFEEQKAIEENGGEPDYDKLGKLWEEQRKLEAEGELLKKEIKASKKGGANNE